MPLGIPGMLLTGTRVAPKLIHRRFRRQRHRAR